MVLNPFYWLRFLLYLFFHIESVAVLKRSRRNVGWYFVFDNKFYRYIYSIEHAEKVQLNNDFTLSNVIHPSLRNTHFIEWKPLFTFRNKKNK